MDKKLTSKNIWSVCKVNGNCKSVDSMKYLYSQFPLIQDAANAINDELKKICSFDAPQLHQNTRDNIRTDDSRSHITTNLQIDEEKVWAYLKKLKTNKASQDIPNILYKKAASIIVAPLTYLFNLSLSRMEVPTIWKTCAVIPVPKSPTPSTNEIRPISLMPVPLKILERIVTDNIKEDLLNLYGKDQFGFRPGSSTTCALISLHQAIMRYLDSRDVNGVQLLAYDYSKAFDTLLISTVMKRLEGGNFDAGIKCWLQDYLKDRRQYVKLGNTRSHIIRVDKGVPQGSVLGPHLFSAVTGTLDVSLEDCHAVLYADDVTLCVPLYRNSSNLHVLRIHQKIVNWSCDNGLILNDKKCKSLLITASKNCVGVSIQNISFVTSLCILGVTFNARGNWRCHIEKVVRNASRRLHPIRILKYNFGVNDDILKTVYFATVRSILEYCAPLLLGLSVSDSNGVNKIQRRFHKMLCGSHCKEDCLPDLHSRRMRLGLQLLERMKQPGHILNHLLPTYSTSGRIILPVCRTKRFSNSFIFQVSLAFNDAFKRK